jgi:hypothetical protein
VTGNPIGAGNDIALGAGGTGGTGRVLDFRRRPTPPRRRRRSVLAALARPFAAALALVALPLAVGAWVLGSPRFALREVTVEGTGRIPTAWLQEAVAPLLGENLVVLPLSAVTGRVARHPWIATLAVEKELPDRLRIAVTERQPVALLALPSGKGETLVYADRQGRPIAPVVTIASGATGAAGEKLPDLLIVRLAPAVAARPQDGAAGAVGDRGGVARALAVAGELGRANPDWAAGLTRVEVLSEEDFRLETSALPFPLLVRRGQVAGKVRYLQALLPELGRRYAHLEGVDLRFSRRIVVQPGTAAGIEHEPPASSGPPGPAAEL